MNITETKGGKASLPHRVLTIDFVRGLAVVLMALDHASLYWNEGRGSMEGLQGFRPIFPDLLQFLVRFVSHWCAPTFIFLAGTSLALSEVNRLKKGTTEWEITKHFIIRGLVLLAIEWTLIALIFSAAPFYFGVLACIGIGIIIFAFLRLLPTRAILVFSLTLLLFSPLMFYFVYSDIAFALPASLYYFQVAFFDPVWPYGLYPLIPWIGIMGLGYVFGHWVQKQQQLSNGNQLIAKRLAIIGAFCLGAFVIFRIGPINIPGGWPFNYLAAESFSLDHFFLLAKYPPSLVFLFWTLGGMCLALSAGFKLQNQLWFQKWTIPIVVFGTTPLFFYVAHLYLYSIVPITFSLLNSFSLLTTLIVWFLGLMILHPLCLRFQMIKKRYFDSPLKYI